MNQLWMTGLVLSAALFFIYTIHISANETYKLERERKKLSTRGIMGDLDEQLEVIFNKRYHQSDGVKCRCIEDPFGHFKHDVKQAFISAGYKRHIQYDGTEWQKLMTGQEWLERFNKELDKEADHLMCGYKIVCSNHVEHAARQAAGLDKE